MSLAFDQGFSPGSLAQSNSTFLANYFHSSLDRGADSREISYSNATKFMFERFRSVSWDLQVQAVEYEYDYEYEYEEGEAPLGLLRRGGKRQRGKKKRKRVKKRKKNRPRAEAPSQINRDSGQVDSGTSEVNTCGNCFTLESNQGNLNGPCLTLSISFICTGYDPLNCEYHKNVPHARNKACIPSWDEPGNNPGYKRQCLFYRRAYDKLDRYLW